MNEEVSALMDGQLDADQAANCLNRLKRDPEAREHWEVYHLIGDAMRGHTRGTVSPGFRQRLEAEPTILAPRRRRVNRPIRLALSAAASVAAVGFVGWMSYPFFNGAPGPQVAVAAPPQQAEVVVVPVAQDLDDYRLAHRRFAPGIGMGGEAPYVRTVSAQDGQR